LWIDMIDAAPLPPSEPDLGELAEAERLHDLALLRASVDHAARLAAAYRDQALARLETIETSADIADAERLGRAADRCDRSMRQGMALKHHVLSDRWGEQRKAREARQAQDDKRATEVEARRAVVGHVTQASIETAMNTAGRPRLETEKLLADLTQVIDAFEDDIFLDVPTGQTIALLCQGAGVPFDLDRWAHQAWAKEEINTRVAGSPYVGYRPGPDVDTTGMLFEEALNKPP